MSRQWDALVIGAGPAGLRAASVIAESGLEVVLVDEQAFPAARSTAMSRLRARRSVLPRPPITATARSLSGASGVPARNTCRKRRSGSWNRIAS